MGVLIVVQGVRGTDLAGTQWWGDKGRGPASQEIVLMNPETPDAV